MSFPAFLQRELSRRQARNKSYSLRAFARDLDCDHSTLSQWMRGARPMKPAAVDHVCARLALDPRQRERIDALDGEDLTVLAAVRQGTRSSAGLAATAGLPVDRVNRALFNLMRLDLLGMDGAVWRISEEEMA